MRFAVRRCSRIGFPLLVGEVERRVWIVGSRSFITWIMDISGRYGSHVATCPPKVSHQLKTEKDQTKEKGGLTGVGGTHESVG